MTGRSARIVDTLVGAFDDLMAANPAAFRTKFRKMAADPFAFYRGSACLSYADVAEREDPWANEQTSRVWIQGDLHAENFGTYMDGDGVLIFDVNDFAEAYIGHFTWDVMRFAASMALMGWCKAISDDDISTLIERFVRGYVDQVRSFVARDDDRGFSLNLRTAEGAVHQVLQLARLRTRVGLLDGITEEEGYDRVLRDGPGVRRLDDDERAKVVDAFTRYLDSIPESKRFHGVAYTVKDAIGRSGFGLGSAGLPAYTVLIERLNEALDNDVVVSTSVRFPAKRRRSAARSSSTSTRPLSMTTTRRQSRSTSGRSWVVSSRVTSYPATTGRWASTATSTAARSSPKTMLVARPATAAWR